MHQSSTTIGAIAAALAKAQVELENPEKSLTASIAAPPQAGGNARTFRYAPLSAGLEIVRKCLGKHEIAAIQTTTVDTGARMVRLTTVLAHTSGEWISSDWPVCTLGDIAIPQRMGAALTYARRYALFTLVGIAGEDDLDGPDLTDRDTSEPAPHPTANNIVASTSPMPAISKTQPALSPGESERTRHTLLQELSALSTAEDLTAWARTTMPRKNALLPADAGIIEQAFETQVLYFEGASGSAPSDPEQTAPGGTPIGDVRASRPKQSRLNSPRARPAGKVDKSVLAFATVKRQRNKLHLKFVAKHPCLICAREPSDAHHVRFAQPRGLGQKVSDEFTVPLCRVHHREVHSHKNEQDWWHKVDLDPLKAARQLWRKSVAGEEIS